MVVLLCLGQLARDFWQMVSMNQSAPRGQVEGYYYYYYYYYFEAILLLFELGKMPFFLFHVDPFGIITARNLSSKKNTGKWCWEGGFLA